jgi:hypothetical protein
MRRQQFCERSYIKTEEYYLFFYLKKVKRLVSTMATAEPSASSLPEIRIEHDGEKLGRIRLAHSSTAAQLRTTISNQFQLSSHTYFLDKEGYPLDTEDETTEKISDLLNERGIIAMKTDANISIPMERSNKTKVQTLKCFSAT